MHERPEELRRPAARGRRESVVSTALDRRRRPWASPEGIEIKPRLRRRATSTASTRSTPGPGLSPFLRGPYPTMYTTQPWTIRQYAGFSTAEESNAFYRRNLAAGQKGLSVAFDLATHRGYDSDHPRVRGDVGMAGVAIDSIYDARTLFDGIPLDEMSVSMTMNGAVLPVLALYIAAAEEQGVKPEQLAGTIQNDILKEFMVRNTYIYPPQPSMRIISDIFSYTAEKMPRFNSISISGYHMQEAGATADLELAYTLADGVEYLRAGLARRPRRSTSFAPRLSLLLGDRHELLHGGRQDARRPGPVGAAGARLRPAEPQVAEPAHPQPDQRLVADRAGRLQQRRAHLHRGDGRDPGPHPVAAHQRPRRGDRAADRLLAPGSPATPSCCCSRRAAPRASSTRGAAPTTSSGSPTTSPSGPGRHIQEAEQAGGMAKAIEQGIPKMRIEEAAARTQARIDSGAQEVIGVNTYRLADEDPLDVLQGRQRRRLPPADRQARAAARRARRRRGAAHARRADRRPAGAAEGEGGNLLALAVDAARAKATVGEISDALEKVYGRHQAMIRTI